jgi:hypothetical protein
MRAPRSFDYKDSTASDWQLSIAEPRWAWQDFLATTISSGETIAAQSHHEIFTALGRAAFVPPGFALSDNLVAPTNPTVDYYMKHLASIAC